MKHYDLVVIGGGSAGMASAIQARNEGIKEILILEKEDNLGGILNQCIHNGFGLTEFKSELTGPEYMQRFIDQVNDMNIDYVTNAMVIDITKDKKVTYSSKAEGTLTVEATAIVMATGCYERSAGAIKLPGDRCSGIITAGTAQKYLNIHGYLCGKRIVILGSGDVGLIMARRLTLEGAKVICVSEIMPYSNGLNRNISQCLNDFNIPLYLSRTVSKVIGKNRLEKVILTAVDENKNFIPNTDMEIECDTLILSIGLIPYISLLDYIDCQKGTTKGPIVNEYMETNIEGIFACGNCLHVHDVVDFVTKESRLAGHGAALYIKNQLKEKYDDVLVKPSDGVSYVVPQKIQFKKEDILFKMRAKSPMKDVFLIAESNGNIINKTYKSVLVPSEMVECLISKDKLENVKSEITFRLEKR